MTSFKDMRYFELGVFDGYTSNFHSKRLIDLEGVCQPYPASLAVTLGGLFFDRLKEFKNATSVTNLLGQVKSLASDYDKECSKLGIKSMWPNPVFIGEEAEYYEGSNTTIGENQIDSSGYKNVAFLNQAEDYSLILRALNGSKSVHNDLEARDWLMSLNGLPNTLGATYESTFIRTSSHSTLPLAQVPFLACSSIDSLLKIAELKLEPSHFIDTSLVMNNVIFKRQGGSYDVESIKRLLETEGLSQNCTMYGWIYLALKYKNLAATSREIDTDVLDTSFTFKEARVKLERNAIYPFLTTDGVRKTTLALALETILRILRTSSNAEQWTPTDDGEVTEQLDRNFNLLNSKNTLFSTLKVDVLSGQLKTIENPILAGCGSRFIHYLWNYSSLSQEV